ncbi:MAG: hypothetical protein GY935_05850 [Gammaproteobacteria bacterium]|nr:hypothetical protein [Gammaproteobacteria bacterium]
MQKIQAQQVRSSEAGLRSRRNRHSYVHVLERSESKAKAAEGRPGKYTALIRDLETIP